MPVALDGQNSLTTSQNSCVSPSSAICLALAVPLASMRACCHAVSRMFIVDVSFRRVVQFCEEHPRPAHESLPSGERRRKSSDNMENRRSGGEAPTSDGLQESRTANRRYSANTGAQRMAQAGRTATSEKPTGVGTSWTERLRARSAAQQINAVPQGRLYGALRGFPFEG